MNKTHRFLALTLGVLLCLSGCSKLLDTQYNAISPHTETTVEPMADSNVQVVGTFEELKSAILRLVRSRSDEGVVRLRNYAGDAERDVPLACRSVSREEPIGVYALDFLSYNPTQMLTDYDVTFSLSYRRSLAQVQAVEYVTGPTIFRERLADTLSDFRTELVVETNYYQESEYNFQDILQQLYYSNPLLAQGRPELSVNLYPNTDLRRVIEVNLYYPDTITALRTHTALCQARVTQLTQTLTEPLEAHELALTLYNMLADICDFDWELYQATIEGNAANASIYDALSQGRSLSEGYALAYKALCDEMGLPCFVVWGRRLADEHFWNLIQLEGEWYHVDLASDEMNDHLTYQPFLLDDSTMTLEYRWDTASFPSAQGDLTYASLFEQAPLKEAESPVVTGKAPSPPSEEVKSPEPEPAEAIE